ncbi:hypothetical protein BP6252_10435 [Coleophoma cylindrospora]|uniref:T6SS Phospholipase effector Tle1-like catalytic domain-containing protein n=1 Tax=Coleophoma cylindrospora TaxID=1849047 RepID=A0A3D8QTE0_9HELO|nr:hypothetical protein BP6252_10435 [Coleophoma cylindrospora]
MVGTIDRTRGRTGKRLVILCDGTWQNAEGETPKPPTNIVRLARAIEPTAIIKGEDGQPDREVDQVVYYQSGVGTGVFDGIIGGAIGLGLSSKVRAAYGWLADNYVEGDTICIFGFSRGAYTARSIAGLITKMGLLSKRGMDNFLEVYNQYYKNPNISPSLHSDYYERNGLTPLPRGTIEVVGVFDTVGFHRPITGRIPGLNRFIGEEYELPNTILSDHIKYAFHALALDESRVAYKPTLFYKKKEGTQSFAGTDNVSPGWDGKTVLKQCWFSGQHEDCGGGKNDPRLSNIALGWMVSECEEAGVLTFNASYILRQSNVVFAGKPWGTALGFAGPWWENLRPAFLQRIVNLVFIIINFLVNLAHRWGQTKIFGLDIGGIRTPGKYYNQDRHGHLFQGNYETCEFLHSSVLDRKLGQYGPSAWPCRSLQGRALEKRGNTAVLVDKLSPSNDLRIQKPGTIELRCKNNVRNAVKERSLPQDRKPFESFEVQLHKTAKLGFANGL